MKVFWGISEALQPTSARLEDDSLAELGQDWRNVGSHKRDPVASENVLMMQVGRMMSTQGQRAGRRGRELGRGRELRGRRGS